MPSYRSKRRNDEEAGDYIQGTKIDDKFLPLDVSDSDASVFKMFSTCNVKSKSDSSPTVDSKSVHNFDM